MAPSHCSRWEGIYDLKKHYLFLKAPSDANGGLHMSISYASKMVHKMATSVLGSPLIFHCLKAFSQLEIILHNMLPTQLLDY